VATERPTNTLLAQHVRQRTSEFDLLAEHAAYCQALAQVVSDGLALDAERSSKAAADWPPGRRCGSSRPITW
jgi:hypothetical protein